MSHTHLGFCRLFEALRDARKTSIKHLRLCLLIIPAIYHGSLNQAETHNQNLNQNVENRFLGTCDEPKLVCLSHHNIYLQCFNFMEMLENPSKVISFFPLSWITQTIIACSSLEFGVTRIMAPTFNERTACKMIHDFVIDVAVLGTVLALRLTGNVAVKVRLLLHRLMSLEALHETMCMFKDFNLSCLKCAVVGVVNTSKNDLTQMRRGLPNVKFIQVYSLTETGLVAAVPAANYSEALERPTAVGKLLRNCKVKILDPETKQSVGPGQIGELYFHGDGLMLGSV